MDHLKKLVEAVTKAEELVKQQKAPPLLSAVLADLAWTGEPLPRELMVLWLSFRES